jgi:hypothetical protein
MSALLVKKDAIFVKTDTDASNARKTSSLKTTFVLLAVMSDMLKSRTLVKNVQSATVIPAILETSEDARNVSKTTSYTIINAIRFAPLELSLLHQEHASPVVMTALFAKIKTPAQDVLMENFYKEKLANLSVMMALHLSTEFAHPARI